MIAIIDYGMGNLKSVYNAFLALGAEVKITSSKKDLANAKKLILPGVGAFGDAIKELHERDLFQSIKMRINKGVPFLGICLGLQLLFERSEENPNVEGLSFFEGDIIKFSGSGMHTMKVPHMGWNAMEIEKEECPLLKKVSNGSYFYFVHSYYASIQNKDILLGKTSYGVDFASMVWKDNVYASQFHPEKSQDMGLQILRNYMEI